MRVFLVHHADALSPAADAQRPLSTRGLGQAARLAAKANEHGCRPAVIWHSGKLRSRQTAEAFYRACNPMAEFRMILGLRPDDPAQHVRGLLAGETQDVLMVGHMPSLPDILRTLTADPGTTMPLNGMVALEQDGTAWREIWRLTPD